MCWIDMALMLYDLHQRCKGGVLLSSATVTGDESARAGQGKGAEPMPPDSSMKRWPPAMETRTIS